MEPGLTYRGGLISWTIDSVSSESEDVRTLTLVPDRTVSYKAGQFLTFIFRTEQGEDRRSYSLSSSPDWNDPFSITVKRVPNGKYSRPLTDRFGPGDTLYSIAPAGQFVLPEDVQNIRQIFFFAAGVGFTPIRALIRTALRRHPHLELVLFYSNTDIRSTIFHQELLELQQKYPQQLKLEFLFSSTRDLARARLSKWLLPRLLQPYLRAAPEQQLFYTCGPFPYMRMVMLTLEELGYRQDQIRRELFDLSLPVPKPAPPDQSPRQVRLVTHGDEKRFIATYPQTILQAAKQNGIELPFSCESGRCGSCVAVCTSGKVWMSYNEVLTDTEIAHGLVLTCTGYPVGGDIVLQV